MEKELGPDVIKATQTSLGKYIKRPPLSDKLLKKPPFRFLHDIVTSVLKTNRLFEGLFEEDELISDNVKDRDSKILFLNKVISVLALTTGKSLSVKPSKIIAGQEAEKTNELLQCIAYALDKKLSTSDAVKKYRENTKVSPAGDVKTKAKEPKLAKNSSNDTKKLTSRSSEKLSTKKESVPLNKNDKTKTSEIKTKKKQTGLSKNDPPQVKNLKSHFKAVGKKSSVESVSSSTLNDAQENHEKNLMDLGIEKQQNVEIKSAEEVVSLSTTSLDAVDANELNNPEIEEKEAQEKLNSSYTIGENELNSSLSSQDLMDVRNDKGDDSKSIEKYAVESNDIKSQDQINAKKLTNEPDESRISLKKPRPVLIPKHDSFDLKRVKEPEQGNTSVSDNTTNYKQSSESIRPPSVRPSSSRPGAPRLRDKVDNIVPENDNLILGKVNIITENSQNDEEDTSVIIVEQDAPGSDKDLDDQQEVLQFSSNEHGHLVQQILNSQKELSHIAGKTEIEWQFGTQRAKEASSQEIEQLRFNIQALSRVANPLGKLLDHVQEDVEVMRQELQQWTKVYEEVSRDMLKEKAATEETLVPLQTRVNQLDLDIEEKRDKINDIKILIHKNTTRIEKLLANGNVQ